MGRPYIYSRADDLGIPVKDASQRMFVAVTAHDVINAKKANSKHCALARAALRLPEVNAAYFFRQTAFLEYEDKILKFELPVSVQKEIVSFDRAQIFAPGVYQLSPPPPSSRSPKARKAYRDAVRDGKRKIEFRKPTLNERTGLKDAIAKIARSAPLPDTPEGKEFERMVASAEKGTPKAKKPRAGSERASGIVGPRAAQPLMPGGPNKFVRRSQYVRTLDDPGDR